MSQFFTNEAVSLEKEIDSVINPPVKSEQMENTYELAKCVDWIKSNNLKKVCLQFPDHLLPDSANVALRLESTLGQNVYILADTAYESCCIDYVAAAHINADGIIHFGPACFSKTSANLPFLNIYEKYEFDFDRFHASFTEKFQNQGDVIILLDTEFIHLTDQFRQKFPSVFIEVIDKPCLNLENRLVLFIGGRSQHRKLPNLKFSHKPSELYSFNVQCTPHLINYEQDEKVLRRRYFLIEKIKDSNTVGIVIGTLGVKNYLKAIERLKTLFKLHKKKYYMLSVGKPTVAKLANFPEIDIYVIVTCALNEIYDSRDYYKPIVTIYDVEMALNSTPTPLEFTYDYETIISRPINDVIEDTSDVSLLSGKIRGSVIKENTSGELIAKDTGTVALTTTHGAGYLATRSWKGLERTLGEGEVKMAEEGRRGIAQGYNGERI